MNKIAIILNRQIVSTLSTLLTVVLLTAGCGLVDVPAVPEIPDIPDLPDIPGLPGSFDDLVDQVPGLLDELELPDLSQIPGLPELSDLPAFSGEPGVLTFQGPMERSIAIGERIPGTDIELVSVTDQSAQFRIAGYDAPRSRGDSLDFDGEWAAIPGVEYTVRLRVYHIGSDSVRAAGVHRMVVENIQPAIGQAPQTEQYIRLPFSISADNDQLFKGMSLGYLGSSERGAEISGLPGNEYPFRKTGDTVVWEGTLRPDIPARYNLRLLFYTEQGARLGGTVSLYLPGL